MSAMPMSVMMMVMVAVGAAFRLERPLHRPYRGAKSNDHVRKHMVRADDQRSLADLGRNMTIAEMPGDPDRVNRIGNRNLEYRFGGCPDPYPAAVFKLQSVALPHCHRPLEIEQYSLSVIEFETDPATMTRIEVQGHAVARRSVRPVALTPVVCCPAHQNRK